MSTDKTKEIWKTDQIAKSGFFHQKLHEWNLLEIAYELEKIKGEKLEWYLTELNIKSKAWNKIIHRGIKPIRVFSHPEVLKENPKRVSYYRMLAMVSQKSMTKIGLAIKTYEEGKKELDNNTALKLARHLNSIISNLIEFDEEIDPREFDLWRGMTAGSQAQGSWQNAKGNQIEILIKDLIKHRLKEKNLIYVERFQKKSEILELKDGRILLMSEEPDIGIYKDGIIQIVIEIKGGIDTAGVLERFGAALKSLRRAKQENPNSVCVLLIQGISLTNKAKEEIDKSKKIIDHVFTVEEIISDEETRKRLFGILQF
ncbi:MAG: XcyI family restriction endonuclease [Candidatus Helarchaeota archaeon]